jgi:hypothetical protein
MSNTAAKVAFALFVVLITPAASFARASSPAEAGFGRSRPNAAAFSALDNMSVNPNRIGNASKMVPIPLPRIAVRRFRSEVLQPDLRP